MVSAHQLVLGLASLSTAFAAYTFPPYQVRNVGEPVGQIKNISGSTSGPQPNTLVFSLTVLSVEMYHSYAPGRNATQAKKAILYISDIFGVPLLQNKLLADSFAGNDYLVVMPDLFAGDAISVEEQEAGLNLTEWRALHPVPAIDAIINKTIAYMREDLGVESIGAVGYCFGGKYVPRFLKGSEGVDVGFIAHPSALTEQEIEAVGGPLSIAAGTLDASFNSTAKGRAESILNGNNVTFQTNLYYGAPHGFGVRVNQSIPQQAYAKQASFVQAVTWFNAWL
jgi:dienelactone hydrolase